MAEGEPVSRVCPTCAGHGHVLAGADLRTLRQTKGLTQRAVATRFDLTIPYLCSVETTDRVLSLRMQSVYAWLGKQKATPRRT